MRYYLYVLIFLLVSCIDNHDKSSDKNIEEVAMKEGKRISSLAQKALGSQLMKKVSQDGAASALEFCNLAAYPILDSLKTDMEVIIKRAAIKNRNPKNRASEVESTLIYEYEKQLKNDERLEPRVQVLNDEEILFAAPIKTKNALCLNCHGKVGSEINDETLAAINTLYPKDNAVNHKVGDLRGIWSLTFKKDELIKLK
ncbi:MAG TPA: DUF3365 domain-containing protein [Cyclobacteriaceae bacterium]